MAISTNDEKLEMSGANAQKSVSIQLRLWPEHEGEWIHIRIAVPGESITTVTNNPASNRYHRTLFRNLRRLLIEQSRWPFGEEGAETEEKESSLRFDPVPILGDPLSATIIADRG